MLNTLFMKKTALLAFCVLASLASGMAALPDKVIPFILDHHIYVQGSLADTIPVSLIYDTGADCLYLDKDYMAQSSFGRLPLKRGKVYMGGAGNGGVQGMEMIVSPVALSVGALRHTAKMSPVINLREIAGRQADGMFGNDFMWQKPLAISYSDSCLRQIDRLTPDVTEGYTRMPAEFDGGRVKVRCEMQIDSVQKLSGLFLLDLGCGTTIVLNSTTLRKIDIEHKRQAVCYYANYGVGGDGRDIRFRIDSFSFLDKLENVVVSASCNTKGALSGEEYLGVIGNDILCHYDLIIDAPGKALYARRNENADKSYQQSSRLQFGYIDRTDVCDGWGVGSLYQDGIAQKAGLEIGDIVVAINGRPVKSVSWEERRRGLNLSGETTFRVRKADGKVVDYTLFVADGII